MNQHIHPLDAKFRKKDSELPVGAINSLSVDVLPTNEYTENTSR